MEKSSILDGHIHVSSLTEHRPGFQKRLDEAKIGGGLVISLPPRTFCDSGALSGLSTEMRLDNVLAWCAGHTHRFPFFWIDPLEDGADEQVAQAVERGIRGFKIICDRFHPGDDRVLNLATRIARARRPILFHAGILWDGKPSAQFNRPAEFEPLLGVDTLRFCLAHIAWPWCDELIAVYGKFLNARTNQSDRGVEMFVDTTPGTPPIYRRDALAKLFGTGYDVCNNVIFGSDCQTNDYHVDWVRQWVERDTEILKDAGLSGGDMQNYYSGNLLRFVDASASRAELSVPRVAT